MLVQLRSRLAGCRRMIPLSMEGVIDFRWLRSMCVQSRLSQHLGEEWSPARRRQWSLNSRVIKSWKELFLISPRWNLNESIPVRGSFSLRLAWMHAHHSSRCFHGWTVFIVRNFVLTINWNLPPDNLNPTVWPCSLESLNFLLSDVFFKYLKNATTAPPFLKGNQTHIYQPVSARLTF